MPALLQENDLISLQNTPKLKKIITDLYKKNPNIHIDFYKLINIIEEVMNNNTECKKRKNVENNGYELIVAFCLSDENIRTKEDCMNVLYGDFCKKVKGCSEEDFNKYKEDIEKRKENDINKYISKFVNGDDNARNLFSKELGESFNQTGFAIIKNHDLSKEKTDLLYDAIKTFFALDEENKIKY